MRPIHICLNVRFLFFRPIYACNIDFITLAFAVRKSLFDDPLNPLAIFKTLFLSYSSYTTSFNSHESPCIKSFTNSTLKINIYKILVNLPYLQK
uniref:Uncharacterized 10.9 kDa protein in secA 5'region n=1 Tax=Diacronema lutheri TaxID=2081491 RepID=YCX1_DIALT|nr:RecName: Full=Uncharacterized 10.9 kDa protein in secA 5'region [Diacronema lutheri]CAA46775.1 unnamed protein product [Diacronema lutheri]